MKGIQFKNRRNREEIQKRTNGQEETHNMEWYHLKKTIISTESKVIGETIRLKQNEKFVVIVRQQAS